MNYAYVTFAGVAIPAYLPDHDTGSDEAIAPLLELPGRAPFDPLGGERAPLSGRDITVGLAALAATEGALQPALDALRGLVGRVDDLVIALGGGGTRQRKARLLSVPMQGRATNFRHQPLTLLFRLQGEHWEGSAHADVYTLDAVPKDCVVNNAGNLPVRNAAITVYASVSTITQLSVEVSGVSQIIWDGSLGAGQYLYIDCGAWSVKRGSADAYDGLSRGAGHTIDEWLRLGPGDTTVRVTRTGGGSASWVRFAFHDGWA